MKLMHHASKYHDISVEPCNAPHYYSFLLYEELMETWLIIIPTKPSGKTRRFQIFFGYYHI